MTLKPLTAAADNLDIYESILQKSKPVKSAVVVLPEISDAIANGTTVFGSKKTVSPYNFEGLLVSQGALQRGGESGSAYRTDKNKTLRISEHSARATNFSTSGENISISLLRTNKTNSFESRRNC